MYVNMVVQPFRVAGFIISAVALYYVFRDQDPVALLLAVRRAHPFPFVSATVLVTAVFWIRAWRWKALLKTVQPNTAFRSRFGATTIRFMANNVFPSGRVGEIAGPWALAKIERLPFVSSMTSIVLERVLDALTVVNQLARVHSSTSLARPGRPSKTVLRHLARSRWSNHDRSAREPPPRKRRKRSL